MSKMSELAMKIEHKYSMKVGDYVKCQNDFEATLLADGLADDGIETRCIKFNEKPVLVVTKVR